VHVTNTVTGVAARIARRQRIVLRGAHVKPFPGNSNVCFENLCEVRPPSSDGILNPRKRLRLQPYPPKGFGRLGAKTAGTLITVVNNKGRFQDGVHLKIVDSRDAWRADWIKSARP
jgi:hypothetical protein